MSLSVKKCHLCKCPKHEKDWQSKQWDMRRLVHIHDVGALKALLSDFSNWYKTNGCKSQLSQATIIKRSCDMHQVFNHENCFLLKEASLEAAKVLIEKGFDINTQDSKGNTRLHLSSMRFGLFLHDNEVEFVSMLLCYGADPMIRNVEGQTALDIMIEESGYYSYHYNYNPHVSLIEHLLNYTFDECEEYDIDAVIFLSATIIDPPMFEELITKNIRKVVFNDPSPLLLGYISRIIFTMKPLHLQIITEKFEYVLRELLEMIVESPSFSYCKKLIQIENFDILLNSRLKVEFADWLCAVGITGAITNILRFYNNEPFSIQNFVCLLLSYGVKFSKNDFYKLFNFYHHSGYYKMFKMFLYMDVEHQSLTYIKDFKHTEILPTILYNVTLDIPEMIEKKKFSVECLIELLPYFTVPFDLFSSNWETKERVRNRPQIPSLVELARNVFRKYFIERFRITNALQFYTYINLLPIGTYHKEIISYEAKLY